MFSAPKNLSTLETQIGSKNTGSRLIHAMYEEAGPGAGSIVKKWFFTERPDFIMKFFTWHGSAKLQPLAA